MQLTKDKTIDVKMPWEGGSKKGASKGRLHDVVGVELGGGDPRGCPAVRLSFKKGLWSVAAAGFVPAPEGELPGSWEAVKACEWTLPSEFQAPCAAIAVSSSAAVTRQIAMDALNSDIEQKTPAAAAAGTDGKKKLGVRRNGETAAKASGEEKAEPVPEAGVPTSRNGMRMVHLPLADGNFAIQAGLPEYQLKWVSHLLPEGRRPTAYSVQTAGVAQLAALAQQPEFTEADGTAVAVYVSRSAVNFAAYREGRLLLFRNCPGVQGYEVLREVVKASLGVDDSMVESIMDDTLVDPRPAMEPFLRTMGRQLEISLDYVARKYGMRDPKIFLMGLRSGATYWNLFAQETMGVGFTAPNAFEGYALPPKIEPYAASESQAFIGALGAARAAMEGNE